MASVYVQARTAPPGCYVGYLWGQREVGGSGLHGLSGLCRGWHGGRGATGGGERGNRRSPGPSDTNPTFLYTLHWAEGKELWCVTSLKSKETSLLLTSEPSRTSEKVVNLNYDTKGHQSSWLAFLCTTQERNSVYQC